MLGVALATKKSLKSGEDEITVIKRLDMSCSTECSFTSPVVIRVVVPGGHADHVKKNKSTIAATCTDRFAYLEYW